MSSIETREAVGAQSRPGQRYYYAFVSSYEGEGYRNREPGLPLFPASHSNADFPTGTLSILLGKVAMETRMSFPE